MNDKAKRPLIPKMIGPDIPDLTTVDDFCMNVAEWLNHSVESTITDKNTEYPHVLRLDIGYGHEYVLTIEKNGEDFDVTTDFNTPGNIKASSVPTSRYRLSMKKPVVEAAEEPDTVTIPADLWHRCVELIEILSDDDRYDDLTEGLMGEIEGLENDG